MKKIFTGLAVLATVLAGAAVLYADIWMYKF